MVTRKHAVVAAVGIVVAIALVLCLGESETSKVKKRFNRLSEFVSKNGEEPLLQMATRAKSIGTLFGNVCTLTTPIYDFSGSYDRSEIVSNAARWRAQFSSLSLSFTDVSVEITGDQSARATATVTLKGDSASGGFMNETREVDCTLAREDGKWLFVDWTVVDVLKK